MRAALPIVGALAALWLAGSPASAQGNDSGSIAGQSNSGTRIEGREVGPKGTVAHVGAGTTDGATTGHSGPKNASSGVPGEVNVPPLPNASQCDDYKGTPAYEGCLWVVLRQERKGP